MNRNGTLFPVASFRIAGSVGNPLFARIAIQAQTAAQAVQSYFDALMAGALSALRRFRFCPPRFCVLVSPEET